MDISLHYLTMANQMLIQKRLLERGEGFGAYAWTAEGSGLS